MEIAWPFQVTTAAEINKCIQTLLLFGTQVTSFSVQGPEKEDSLGLVTAICSHLTLGLGKLCSMNHMTWGGVLIRVRTSPGTGLNAPEWPQPSHVTSMFHLLLLPPYYPFHAGICNSFDEYTLTASPNEDNLNSHYLLNMFPSEGSLATLAFLL